MASPRHAPRQRRLRVFALDPSYSQQLDAAAFNEMVVSIPWEPKLRRGPVGEYFEVHDPAHPRVDLNDPALLAQDGLAPAAGQAQFHQQMVYAIAMKVVENVERALGRKLLWNPHSGETGRHSTESDAFYRLRLIPHGTTDANAYYSFADRAMVFGYFPASPADESHPGVEMIYTCLSHDIVAHELTHVVIASLLPHSMEPTSIDSMAFHEAVADLTAILQRFEISPVVEDVIRRTRGNLAEQHLLANLAVQFGRALGQKSGLRSALGGDPKPDALARTVQPHARGAIMLAAVFDAFLAIYNRRIAPLLRIATNGTGVLPPGDPHPDLVKRMAGEASATARTMLDLILRALDYCPPVDITFSDYLRAIVTADYENSVDDRTFRLAIIEAFRRRGIVAEGTRGFSEDAVRWPPSTLGFFLPSAHSLDVFSDCWKHSASRRQIHAETSRQLRFYEEWLQKRPLPPSMQHELGLALPAERIEGEPWPFRVEALRPTRRVTKEHAIRLDWVIHVVQESPEDKSFRGGCTLIVDADTGHVRYAIAKDIRDPQRAARQRKHLTEEGTDAGTATPPAAAPNPVAPIVSASVASPTCRRLRTYAFDPTLSWQIDTAVLNQTTLAVRWEPLQPGPVGDYIEVIDHDPSSKCFYAPIDLNDPVLLAQDGLAPSEGSAHFHQQMVYAVAMNTIAHFERALGCPVQWSARPPGGRTRPRSSGFVRRLRLYPHALRQPNAYYDPGKKAILFGYFPASTADPGRNLPGGMVFSCLSQDIIAHETTHAILDGLHGCFLEPTNHDALAFHEAFADIVALFQHFSHAEALSHQIAKTRGDLTRQNLLGELAQQFGEATGRYGALRSAIGRVNPATRRWEPIEPDPADLERATESHERGAILVAAVFDLFLTIYKARVTDLIRIATGGTGRLPEGDIHPDLVERLSLEAGRSATHVLQMCIRALDYCPPFDLTFGEFLRALITADYELFPEDPRAYRVAVVEAFRRRGIHPSDVRTFSEDSLRWRSSSLNLRELDKSPGKMWFKMLVSGWRLHEDRNVIFDRMWRLGREVTNMLHAARLTDRQQRELGIVLGARAKGLVTFDATGRAGIEVHSVRRARRISADMRLKVDLVIELTQQHVRPYEEGESAWPPFRGGCTLIVDPDTGEVRYCIAKDIRSRVRLERQRAFVSSPEGLPLQAAYFGDPRRQPSAAGLLAILHEGDIV